MTYCSWSQTDRLSETVTPRIFSDDTRVMSSIVREAATQRDGLTSCCLSTLFQRSMQGLATITSSLETLTVLRFLPLCEIRGDLMQNDGFINVGISY